VGAPNGMIDARSLCHFRTVKNSPQDVGIEELLGDGSEGALRDAGIGKHDVDLPVPLFHFVVQLVEIREVCDVSAYSRHVLSRSALRQIQSVLAASCNEDVRAFRGECVASGHPDATDPSGDNTHLPTLAFAPSYSIQMLLQINRLAKRCETIDAPPAYVTRQHVCQTDQFVESLENEK
jgi:hypothetical protein